MLNTIFVSILFQYCFNIVFNNIENNIIKYFYSTLLTGMFYFLSPEFWIACITILAITINIIPAPPAPPKSV